MKFLLATSLILSTLSALATTQTPSKTFSVEPDTFGNHANYDISEAFESADGKYIVGSTWAGIILWNKKTGKKYKEIKIDGNYDGKLSHSSRYVAYCDRSNQISVMNIYGKLKELAKAGSKKDSNCNKIFFTKDDSSIYFTRYSNVYKWDWKLSKTPKKIMTFDDKVEKLLLTADESKLIAHSNQDLKLYDTLSKKTKIVKNTNPSIKISMLRVSTNGNNLLISGYKKTENLWADWVRVIKIIKMKNGSVKKNHVMESGFDLNDVQFKDDSLIVAYQKTLKEYSASDMSLLADYGPLQDLPGSFKLVNNKHVVYQVGNNTLKVLNLDSGKIVREITHDVHLDSFIGQYSLSSDGKTIVSGGSNLVFKATDVSNLK